MRLCACRHIILPFTFDMLIYMPPGGFTCYSMHMLDFDAARRLMPRLTLTDARHIDERP